MSAKESFAPLTAPSRSLPAVIRLYQIRDFHLAGRLSIMSLDRMFSWPGTEGVLRPIARKELRPPAQQPSRN